MDENLAEFPGNFFIPDPVTRAKLESVKGKGFTLGSGRAGGYCCNLVLEP